MSKKKRTLISGLIAVLMVFTMLPMGALFAFADETQAASGEINPLAGGSTVLEVYTQRGADGTPILARAYDQADLDALAVAGGLGDQGYIVDDAGTRKVVASTSVVPLLGSKGIIVNAGTTFISGDQIVLSDGTNTKTLMYQDLNGTFALLGDATASGDLPVHATASGRTYILNPPTIEAVPAITLNYAIQEISTLTAAATMNAMVTGPPLPAQQSFVFGARLTAVDKATLPAAGDFFDNITSIKIIKSTLTGITVNTKNGSSNAVTENKVFTTTQLEALAQNTKLGFLQANNLIQATDKWIALQDLLKEAGATFEPQDSVTFTASDGFSSTQTYKTITEGIYFYPAATSTDHTDKSSPVTVGAVLALQYIGSLNITGTAGSTVAALDFSTDLRIEPTARFLRGSSEAEYLGSGVAGNQFPTGPVTITVNKPSKIFAGSSRNETAAQIALSAYPKGAEGVIISNGTGSDRYDGKYADALAASTLAGLLDYPILLVEKDSIPAQTLAAIKTLNPKNIVVLGDKNSVSNDVFGQLADYGTVVRKSGENRIDTAVEIYKYAVQLKGSAISKTAIFAKSSDYPDALAIAPYAAFTKSPIFLVDGDKLADSVAAVFTATNFTNAIILGSEDSVSTAIETQIGAVVTPANVKRLEGKNRYETAKAIAEYSVESTKTLASKLTFEGSGIATGQKFPDALTGGPILAKNNSVILLATDADLSVLGLLGTNKNNISKVNIFGDANSVSKKVHTEIETQLGWPAGTIK